MFLESEYSPQRSMKSNEFFEKILMNKKHLAIFFEVCCRNLEAFF